jgi:hypothetical protein
MIVVIDLMSQWMGNCTIVLTTTNQKADNINLQAMAALDTTTKVLSRESGR